MDKHNEQLLAGLSAPVAPAKKPAMMAPPMAPPPQQPYGMQQPYGYGAPARAELQSSEVREASYARD